jgi:ABC-type glycerol-3-phosphate transport system permease component
VLLAFYSWNNFMFAALSGTTQDADRGHLRTSSTPDQLGRPRGRFGPDHLPVIVISLVLQRYVVQGLTAGAIKG